MTLLSVQWMISTLARESASHDIANTTPGAPRMPVPTTESFEHPSRTRTARLRSPSSVRNFGAAVAVDDECDAGLIDRHLIDRDAGVGDAHEHLELGLHAPRRRLDVAANDRAPTSAARTQVTPVTGRS